MKRHETEIVLPCDRKQRGAVLIVGMILILLMSLFVFQEMRTSALEERAALNQSLAEWSFAGAEKGLLDRFNAVKTDLDNVVLQAYDFTPTGWTDYGEDAIGTASSYRGWVHGSEGSSGYAYLTLVGQGSHGLSNGAAATEVRMKVSGLSSSSASVARSNGKLTLSGSEIDILGDLFTNDDLERDSPDTSFDSLSGKDGEEGEASANGEVNWTLPEDEGITRAHVSEQFIPNDPIWMSSVAQSLIDSGNSKPIPLADHDGDGGSSTPDICFYDSGAQEGEPGYLDVSNGDVLHCDPNVTDILLRGQIETEILVAGAGQDVRVEGSLGPENPDDNTLVNIAIVTSGDITFANPAEVLAQGVKEAFQGSEEGSEEAIYYEAAIAALDTVAAGAGGTVDTLVQLIQGVQAAAEAIESAVTAANPDTALLWSGGDIKYAGGAFEGLIVAGGIFEFDTTSFLAALAATKITVDGEDYDMVALADSNDQVEGVYKTALQNILTTNPETSEWRQMALWN